MRKLVMMTFAFGVFGATPAAAQWNMSSFGVAEYDTNETLLLLAGLSASPGHMGWQPVFGVQGYRLAYTGGAEDVTVWSIRPSAGLENRFNGGELDLRAGYAFQDKDFDGPVPDAIGAEGDTDDGVVLTGRADYWGTGALGAQGIVSYNFGGESLWARGRATTRLASLSSGGAVRVGAEVAYLTASAFSVLQPGGLLQWQSPSGLQLGVGVGVKLNENADDATYFKGEIVLPIR